MLINIIFWGIAVFCLVAGIYNLVVYKDKVPAVVKIIFWLILLWLTIGVALWFSALAYSQFYPLGVDVHAPIFIYGMQW